MKRSNLLLTFCAKACLLLVAFEDSAQAVTVYGLGTDNSLFSFDSATPGTVTTIGQISVSGIVDIDFHAANGKLYGMTSTGLAYGIDLTSGAASLLVTPGTSISGVQHFDFNPAADRIRISAAGGNNYRMAPDFITPPSGVAASGTVLNDGVFSGAPSGVSILSLAYTNAFDTPAGSSAVHSTTLYSIGSDGVLYMHSNGSGAAGTFGFMTAVGTGMGAITGPVGFDITADNAAFASVGSILYSVNLTTGAFTQTGTVGASMSSFAIVPEPSTAALALLAGGALLRRRRA